MISVIFHFNMNMEHEQLHNNNIKNEGSYKLMIIISF